MTITQLEIQLIAVVVAMACALPGVFLILRRMGMLSDAISHSILLGIVLAFFITHDLTSPFLIIAATLTGVLTVSLVELLHRTRLVRQDAAIGLIFPFLFSIGVILVSRYGANIHLDTDSVLLGELAFAPFNRMVIFGWDIGPRSLYLMGGILLLNVLFIIFFFKELKLATFDSGLASALGFFPSLLHYGLMTIISITAVGAFDAVGSILVVALMIGPPVSAYLLTDRLAILLLLSALIGAVASILGYWLAHLLDASIAGSIAVMIGLIFLLVYLVAPDRGILAVVRRRHRQRIEFALEMLLVHLLNHEGLPEAASECHINHLTEHFHWEESFAQKVIRRAEREEFLGRREELLLLTDSGRERAQKSLLK